MGITSTINPLTCITIDWHCHLLPGVDDGASTIGDSIAMARLLVAAGVKQVCCTPHQIHGSYEQKRSFLNDLRAEVQSLLDREEIPLQLLGGMEYYLDEFFPDQLADLVPLGKTRMVLVEPPWQAPFPTVRPLLSMILDAGYQPVIAHPERLALFSGVVPRKSAFSSFLEHFTSSPLPKELPTPLRELREMGCGLQGNIGSFTGRYGASVQRLATYLHSLSLYTHFGTDAHTPGSLQEIIAPLQQR